MAGKTKAPNALLAKLNSVYELDDDDSQSIQRLCDRVLAVGAKRDVVREGDQADSLHVLLTGWAVRYKVLEDGGRQIIGILIPGDFCTLATTVSREMDHSVRTLTACEIAEIPRDQLNTLILERPEILRAFWWSTILEKSILRAWIANLGRRNAHSRIAHLLCELHERLRQIRFVEDQTFVLPLTQEGLADAVGLTSVHTNRTLQQLRRESLIEWKGGTVRVLDVTRLGAAAGFRADYLKGASRRA